MTEVPWDPEEIPEDDDLYTRVHQTWKGNDGSVSVKGFQFRDGERSADWEKYADPEETRAGHPENPAEEYGVASVAAADVYSEDSLDLEHAPRPDNRAHSNILREARDPEARVKLRRMSEIIIDVPEQG